MYVLEPAILDLIPDNTFFHITQLIDELKKNNRRVGVYPVYENSWIDVGQWEEYRKAIKYLE
jgi:NDP-sugar pyrophosphorylase family protein